MNLSLSSLVAWKTYLVAFYGWVARFTSTLSALYFRISDWSDFHKIFGLVSTYSLTLPSVWYTSATNDILMLITILTAVLRTEPKSSVRSLVFYSKIFRFSITYHMIGIINRRLYQHSHYYVVRQWTCVFVLHYF